MARIPSADPVSYLVSRRYPNLQPPSPMAQRFNPTPYEPPTESERRAAEAYAAELEALSDEDLRIRYRAAREIEFVEQKAAEERQRPFNLPSAMADNEHWARMDSWTLDEAVALLLGRDPLRISGHDLAAFVAKSEFAAAYAKLAQIARRSVEDGALRSRMRPREYLRWAEAKFIQVPAALTAAVDRFARADLPRDTLGLVLVGGVPTDGPDLVAKAESPLPPAAVTDESANKRELSIRERNTCLKIIIGMAVAGYRFDPKVPRSRIPQEIANDIATTGLSVDVDTVRKWLREAAEMLDSELNG